MGGVGEIRSTGAESGCLRRLHEVTSELILISVCKVPYDMLYVRYISHSFSHFSTVAFVVSF